MRISIITPTIRPEGLEIVNTALKRQTFRDFEWLVVGPKSVFPQPYKKMSVMTEGVGFAELGVGCAFVTHWVQEPPKNKGDVWSLNKAYNKAIKHSSGELLVSWQDYTFADPDCLEKFWFHYKQEPKTLVSAVGNKYEAVYPELGAKVWQDPRERDDQGTYYGVYPSDIEWNLASIPKQALYDIGGFNEKMDKFFGMDAYQVNHRLDDLGGYDFKIDQTIKSYSLPHGRPKDWDKKNALGDVYQEMVAKMKKQGKWPKLEYLK